MYFVFPVLKMEDLYVASVMKKLLGLNKLVSEPSFSVEELNVDELTLAKEIFWLTLNIDMQGDIKLIDHKIIIKENK